MTKSDTRGTQILGTGPNVCVPSAWKFSRAVLPVPIFSENLWAPAQYRICRKCGNICTCTRYINYSFFFLTSCGSNKNYLKEISLQIKIFAHLGSFGLFCNSAAFLSPPRSGPCAKNELTTSGHRNVQAYWGKKCKCRVCIVVFLRRIRTH
jgi:hypothetical protein